MAEGLVRAEFDAHRRVLDASASALPAVLAEVALLLAERLGRGAKVLACGNGGSAAAAQHFVAELVGRLDGERPALAALALVADGAVLTSISNDEGYERAFARQVDALAREGDVLVVLSTSGRSPSVLAAVHAAKERGCAVVALTGEAGLAGAALADRVVPVPSSDVQRVQEIHELCLHAIVRQLEAELRAGAGERA